MTPPFDDGLDSAPQAWAARPRRSRAEPQPVDMSERPAKVGPDWEVDMFDLIVLGGGPAGGGAAARPGELGASVALVERGRMGGACTNDGCVPTRTLAKAARLVRDAEQLAAYGLSG